jgi:hypothetical protein
MTTLQLGLIAGGVLVILGVLLYNWVQERRIRRRIAATFAQANAPSPPPSAAVGRVEPTLAGAGDDEGDGVALARAPASGPAGVNVHTPAPAEAAGADDSFVAPVDFAPAPPSPPVAAPARAAPSPLPPLSRTAETGKGAGPDPDIECVATLQPQSAVGAGAIAAGLHARLGKPLRWFGRSAPDAPWQPLKADTPGKWTELAACLLLADRAGAATRPMLDRFVRLVGEIAAGLPGAFAAPDPQREVERADALDRFCATLDVQIGITVLKAGAATIPGTRLRGVAEAAGFRLADNGRFEFAQEDTGLVLFSLQNYRSEPFTVDNLRLTSTPGAVFILDVPRVPDPVRVFDQMKLAAKRLTQTLDATLVDDNRRPLTDASLGAIRQQVEATAAALREARLDPGSPRALALFGG